MILQTHFLLLALARLNQNTVHSQNTPPQSGEQPDVINNNNNDPLEMLNLALARLAPSESVSQNSSQCLSVEHGEIQTESDMAHSQLSLTQNISSSDPFIALNQALAALAEIFIYLSLSLIMPRVLMLTLFSGLWLSKA